MSAEISIVWTEDEGVEYDLRKMGVPFRVDRVRLSSVDWEWSSRNMGRLTRGVVDAERVDEIASAMRAGIPVPRIVVWPFPSSSSVGVVCGMHRSAAARKLRVLSVEALVASFLDEASARQLAFLDNRREGVRVDRRQAVEFATAERLRSGTPVKVLAERYGVTESSIQMRLRVLRVRSTLVDAGVSARGLCDSQLAVLHKIRNPRVLGAIAGVIVRRSVSKHDIPVLLREIESVGGERYQLAKIGEIDTRLARTESPSRPKRASAVTGGSPSALASALRRLSSAARRYASLDGVAMDPDVKAGLATEWAEVKKIVNGLLR